MNPWRPFIAWLLFNSLFAIYLCQLKQRIRLLTILVVRTIICDRLSISGVYGVRSANILKLFLNIIWLLKVIDIWSQKIFICWLCISGSVLLIPFGTRSNYGIQVLSFHHVFAYPRWRTIRHVQKLKGGCFLLWHRFISVFLNFRQQKFMWLFLGSEMFNFINLLCIFLFEQCRLLRISAITHQNIIGNLSINFIVFSWLV